MRDQENLLWYVVLTDCVCGQMAWQPSGRTGTRHREACVGAAQGLGLFFTGYHAGSGRHPAKLMSHVMRVSHAPHGRKAPASNACACWPAHALFSWSSQFSVGVVVSGECSTESLAVMYACGM